MKAKAHYEKIYHNDVDKYLDVLIANFPEFIMRLPAEFGVIRICDDE